MLSQFTDNPPEWADNVEQPAKQAATCHLFYFGGETRAIGSMAEVGFSLAGGKDVIVFDGPQIPDGLEIKGQRITGRELADLARGREYITRESRAAQARGETLWVVTSEEELVSLLINQYGS